MHAVIFVEGTCRWEERPDPVPGTADLLVAVRAAGINGADLLQRRGGYPAPPGSPPDIGGLELAGEVVAVGEGVSRHAVGDRVMAVVGGGGQAELALVPESCALRVPDGLDWPQAGGFPEVFTTAHDALVTQCQLRLGERVCVHGGAGGVGLAGIQVAAAAGCSVVATVRNAALRDAVAGFGATVVAPDAFVAEGPFDAVLELVGGPNLAGDLEALATGGRIAVIGVGGGVTAELSLLRLMAKRARIHGSTLRARPVEEKAAAAHLVRQQLLPLLAAGRIRVPVEATIPMQDAETAYDRFAAGGKLGKLVLVP